MRRRSRAAAVLGGALVALAGAVVGPAPTVAPVGAATEHRAAVVVDTGTQVVKVCVRFSEPSLTGAQVLERAGVDPVFSGFSGMGAGVCALCGTGCSAGSECLTCDPEGRHWSYHRKPAGASGYAYSRVGASSTTVRDGDVEGWAWGTGGAPPPGTVADICGEVTIPTPTTSTTAPPPPAPPAPPAAATPPPPAPPPGPAAPAPAGGGATVRPPVPTTIPPAAPPAPDVAAPGAAPPDAAAPGADAPAAAPAPSGPGAIDAAAPTTAPAGSSLGGDLAAASGDGRGGDGGGSGSAAGLVGFAAALAAVAGAIVVVRRRRAP